MTAVKPAPVVARLVERIGLDAVLALIEAHGGTRLYVPQEPKPGSPLVQAIGLDAARVLAEDWGGTADFKVPLALRWRTAVYRERKLSYAAIARRIGRTEKTVHVYLQEQSLTQSQLSLLLD